MNMKYKRLIFGGMFLAGLGLLMAACGSGSPFGASPAPTSAAPIAETGGISVEGRVMPKTYATLAFPVNGEISALPVAEGAQVTQGTVLASLGKHEQLEAVRAAAKLEQLTAQQALDTLNRKADLERTQAAQALSEANKAAVDARQVVSDLEKDTYKNTLDDKEKAVQTAKDKLKDNNETLDKYKNLDTDNQTRKDAQKAVDDAQREYDTAITDRDLWKNTKDQALADRDLAEARLADAQREYDNRKDGPDKDQLALAQSRLDSTNANVKSAERTLSNQDVTAPFDGTVTDLNSLAVGQWVLAGRSAVTLADFSEWFIETKDLTELDVVNISEGQKVTVTADAIKDDTFSGQVVAIKKGYSERSGDVLYTVRVKLDKGDERLRWGMTVQVTFQD
jgi:HlyD family secretion protein